MKLRCEDMSINIKHVRVYDGIRVEIKHDELGLLDTSGVFDEGIAAGHFIFRRFGKHTIIDEETGKVYDNRNTLGCDIHRSLVEGKLDFHDEKSETRKSKYEIINRAAYEGIMHGTVWMTDEEYEIVKRVFDQGNWEDYWADVYSPSLYIQKIND